MLGFQQQSTGLQQHFMAQIQGNGISTSLVFSHQSFAPTPMEGCSNPMRSTKIDLTPKFDGNGVKTWIYKYDQFFTIDNTPECDKVKLASSSLEGKALIWHQTLEYSKSLKEQHLSSWDAYSKAITNRFGFMDNINTNKFENCGEEFVMHREILGQECPESRNASEDVSFDEERLCSKVIHIEDEDIQGKEQEKKHFNALEISFEKNNGEGIEKKMNENIVAQSDLFDVEAQKKIEGVTHQKGIYENWEATQGHKDKDDHSHDPEARDDNGGVHESFSQEINIILLNFQQLHGLTDKRFSWSVDEGDIMFAYNEISAEKVEKQFIKRGFKVSNFQGSAFKTLSGEVEILKRMMHINVNIFMRTSDFLIEDDEGKRMQQEPMHQVLRINDITTLHDDQTFEDSCFDEIWNKIKVTEDCGYIEPSKPLYQGVHTIIGKFFILIWGWYYKDLGKFFDKLIEDLKSVPFQCPQFGIHPGSWNREWKIAWHRSLGTQQNLAAMSAHIPIAIGRSHGHVLQTNA